MMTGLQLLVKLSESSERMKSPERSLFLGSLAFLTEAEAEGKGEDPLDDPELQKNMPQAVANTVKSLSGLMKVPGFANTSALRSISNIREKIGAVTGAPKTEAEAEVFKDAELFHALLIKSVDTYAQQLANAVSAKKDTSPEARKNLYQQSLEKAMEESNAQVTAQMQKVPFLKRIFGKKESPKTAIDKINTHSPGFYEDLINTFRDLDPKKVFEIVKSPEFTANRAVQGQIMSQPPSVPEPDAAQSASAESNKNYEAVKSRLGEFRDTFKKLNAAQKFDDESYEFFVTVADKIERSATYEDAQKVLGKKGKEYLQSMIEDAADNFENLESQTRVAAKSTPAGGKEGAGGEGGGAGEEPATSLRSMLFQKNSNKKRSKLDPKAQKIKTSLDNLTQSWQRYGADEKVLGSKDQADLMQKLAAAKDSLQGVKLESTRGDENLIVERWQKLAGLL